MGPPLLQNSYGPLQLPGLSARRCPPESRISPLPIPPGLPPRVGRHREQRNPRILARPPAYWSRPRTMLEEPHRPPLTAGDLALSESRVQAERDFACPAVPRFGIRLPKRPGPPPAHPPGTGPGPGFPQPPVVRALLHFRSPESPVALESGNPEGGEQSEPQNRCPESQLNRPSFRFSGEVLPAVRYRKREIEVAAAVQAFQEESNEALEPGAR